MSTSLIPSRPRSRVIAGLAGLAGLVGLGFVTRFLARLVRERRTAPDAPPIVTDTPPPIPPLAPVLEPDPSPVAPVGAVPSGPGEAAVDPVVAPAPLPRLPR